MKIDIENIMGVGAVHAELASSEPLIVFGRNEAGKTSFATAVAAAVARDMNPRHLKAVKDYVRFGASAGKVSVSDAGGKIEWHPGKKDCFIETGDNPPSSHPFAVGLIDMLSLKSAEDRAKFWEQIFMPALPVEKFRADIMPAITAGAEPTEANEREFQCIVDDIGKNGWDYAEKRYIEHGRAFKREWQNAMASVGIHAKYGRKQADAPELPGWTADLDGMSVADAEREVSSAQAECDAASISDAVEAAVIEAAREAEEKLKPVEAEMSAATPKFEALDAQLADIKKQAQDLKNTLKSGEPDCLCPYCDEPLVIDFTSKSAQKFDGDVEADKKHNAAVHGEIASLKEKYKKVQHEHGTLGTRIREMALVKSSLEGRIKDAEGKREIKGSERDNLSAAESALTAARRNLDLVRARVEADAAHQSVQKVERIVLRLKASGFRSDQVKPKRDKVVALVDKVFGGAKWGTIEMADSDFSILYSGRPLELWSSSTRWRVNAIFQAAIALMTRSSVIILDAADILDDTNMAKFCKWLVGKLATNDISTIVCLTCEHEAFVSESWPGCSKLGLTRHEAAV